MNREHVVSAVLPSENFIDILSTVPYCTFMEVVQLVVSSLFHVAEHWCRTGRRGMDRLSDPRTRVNPTDAGALTPECIHSSEYNAHAGSLHGFCRDGPLRPDPLRLPTLSSNSLTTELTLLRFSELHLGSLKYLRDHSNLHPNCSGLPSLMQRSTRFQPSEFIATDSLANLSPVLDCK